MPTLATAALFLLSLAGGAASPSVQGSIAISGALNGTFRSPRR